MRLAIVIGAQLPHRADQSAQIVHMLGQLGQHCLQGKHAFIAATAAEVESDDQDAGVVAMPCFVAKLRGVADKPGSIRSSVLL